MSNRQPRSTDAWVQSEEGRFDPVVETTNSKFVPIENVPSGDLNPEEACILCEELKKITDPELSEAVRELLAAHSSHPAPPTEDGSEFPPLDSDEVLIARIEPDGETNPYRDYPLSALSDRELFAIVHEDEDDF